MNKFCRLLPGIILVLPLPVFSQHAADSSGHLPRISLDTVQVSNRYPGHVIDYDLQTSGNSWHNRQSANNLSDYLSGNAGFSQITTGGNISKPVLHGLYGNRLLVMVNGLKYDAQQWQDEHGLGLSQIGVKEVSWFNEPQSTEYGAEAVGGVIEIHDEKADSGIRKADATIRIHSNTFGTLTDAGVSDGTHQILWNLRLGIENHADYTDGAGTRILNSRSKGYYLKSGAGFIHKNWRQYNYYNFSYNQFGFIIPDLGTFFTADGRQSRAMSGPHHNVMLHFLNSQNDFKLRGSDLQVNVGAQVNNRAEDEGGGQISLNILLISYLQNATWTKKFLHEKLELQLRENLAYQTNKNHGPRILIPDAHILEANGSATLAYDDKNHLNARLAIGANDRDIHTFPTKYLNAPGKESQPFEINRSAANLNFLLSLHNKDFYSPGSYAYQLFNMISTGSRSGNLAELSSDGLHEGSYQYEIGRSDLAMERNISETLGFELMSHHGKPFYIRVDGLAYYNAFHDYIYLAPTNQMMFGYQIFRYMQQDAHLAGGEGGYTVHYSPGSSNSSIQLQQAMSLIEGVLASGENLPFIPPAKLTTSVQYNLLQTGGGHISDVFISPQLVYNFPQNKPAANELPSPDYALLNLNGGASFNASKKTSYTFTLGIRNLLNKQYADHLSRLRYYGLNNQGLNIVLSLVLKTQW